MLAYGKIEISKALPVVSQLAIDVSAKAHDLRLGMKIQERGMAVSAVKTGKMPALPELDVIQFSFLSDSGE